MRIPNYPVKITVLKRLDPSIIFEGKVPTSPLGKKYEICSQFHEKQEFLVPENSNRCPEGFCAWAWHDIFKEVLAMQSGGSFYPWVEDGMAIACCTDGIRPVSFRIERIQKK